MEHEFSSVPGVKEDVTNIILNLKQVRFKQVVEAVSYTHLDVYKRQEDKEEICQL